MRTPLYFFGHLGRFGAFDNLAPCRFKLDGRWWRSAEHYYQAQKHMPHWPRVNRIRQAWDGLTAKHMGYKVGPVDKRQWDAKKYQVMQRVLWAKFTQNKRLKQLLLQTGLSELVEDNRDDELWGSGANRTGQNWVGRALMDVR